MYYELLLLLTGIIGTLASVLYLVSMSRKGNFLYNVVYSVINHYITYGIEQFELIKSNISLGKDGGQNLFSSFVADNSVNIKLNNGKKSVVITTDTVPGKWVVSIKPYFGPLNKVDKVDCIYIEGKTLLIPVTPHALGYKEDVYVKIKEIGSDEEKCIDIKNDEYIILKDLIKVTSKQEDAISPSEILEYDEVEELD